MAWMLEGLGGSPEVKLPLELSPGLDCHPVALGMVWWLSPGSLICVMGSRATGWPAWG